MATKIYCYVSRTLTKALLFISPAFATQTMQPERKFLNICKKNNGFWGYMAFTSIYGILLFLNYSTKKALLG